MEIISSVKNQFVRQARSLAEKKFRRETGLFLVEGINLIKDMPQSVEVEYVFATQQRADEALQLLNARFAENGDTIANARARVYYVTQEVMDCIADTVSPYGIAAVCKMPEFDFEIASGKALLLDGVSDPGNLGTILRTAAACDFNTIYLLDTADVYSPKTVRASLGAIFKVKTIIVDEAQAVELAGTLNSAVLDMGGDNILGHKFDASILLIAGSEARGVRRILKDVAKQIYALPMNNNIESLNVAVATAVAMYQTV